MLPTELEAKELAGKELAGIDDAIVASVLFGLGDGGLLALALVHDRRGRGKYSLKNSLLEVVSCFCIIERDPSFVALYFLMLKIS